jgi:N4-gp56 family major capsid protein
MSYPSNNNTDINSELFANFVADAEMAAYEQSVSRGMCRLFQVPFNAGKVVQVPVWAAITADLIDDESAATAKTTNTTAPTITLKEHVVYNQITDMLRDSAYGDVMAQLAEQSGMAIGESLDKMVFGEFENFSSDLGTTTTEITTNLILNAATVLRARKLVGPLFCVLHPNQAYNVKKQLTYVAQTNIPALSMIGESALSNYYLGTVGGCAIFESPLVEAVTTGGATAYRAGVFAASALGIAERGGLDLNTLYLPAARATDMVLKAVAGAAVIQSTHGVAITGEGTIG